MTAAGAAGSGDRAGAAATGGWLDRGARAPLLVVCLALLPNLPAAVPLFTYYFRDFSVTFYPLRLFTAREIAAGRWPFWNPYINEGAFGLPTFYPVDLLHVLWPGPVAASWLLTMHFPLAALAAYALARDQGASRTGGLVAGALYALGGLAVSSLNLYVFLQALAWAPLVVLTLRRAASAGGRWVGWAALSLAVAVSTLAVEFVAQAVALGVLLGILGAPHARSALRLAGALALGVGAAGLPVLVTLGLMGETVRGAGFPRDVALGNELHPASLLQVLVLSLFGAPSAPVEAWWGAGFFTKGFPYFLSLYLGPHALALAATGVPRAGRSARWGLIVIAGLALWYALGARGGLASALATLPLLDWFRFPVKAVLLPYLAVALFAGLGADRLRSGEGWRTYGGCTALAAVLAALVVVTVTAAAAPVGRWAALPAADAPAVLRAVAWSAGASAAIAVLGVAMASVVRARRAPAGRAVLVVSAIAVVDLARAGAGMNPQVPPGFFAPLPEIAALDLRSAGRVFSYGLDQSPTFRELLGGKLSALGLWSFFINRQMLAPYNNVVDQVESPEAKDLTSFVLRPPELTAADLDPRRVEQLIPRMRNAAVTRVLSLDPLRHPDLVPLAEVPTGVPRVAVRVYELQRPWPRAYLGCRVFRGADVREATDWPFRHAFDPARDVVLEEPGEARCQGGSVRRLEAVPGREVYEVELDGDGYLVTRDSYARGWEALVDRRPARVIRANGKHRAVPVPSGRHEVVLRYRAPGLLAGVWLTGASLVAIGWCVLGLRGGASPRRRMRPGPPG